MGVGFRCRLSVLRVGLERYHEAACADTHEFRIYEEYCFRDAWTGPWFDPESIALDTVRTMALVIREDVCARANYGGAWLSLRGWYKHRS